LLLKCQASQAELLLRFHAPARRTVQTVFGGTKSARDVRRCETKPPTVLVATPGRLLDHLRNTKAHSHGRCSHVLAGRSLSVVDSLWKAERPAGS
jgi:superfamily II DNA/RNA helicase